MQRRGLSPWNQRRLLCQPQPCEAWLEEEMEGVGGMEGMEGMDVMD